MKKTIILLLAVLMLPVFSSCQKMETSGTLSVTVTVQGNGEKSFSLDVYPHPEGAELKFPVFSEQYQTRKASEKIRLSPGSYVVIVSGLPPKGVNVIAGETVDVDLYLPYEGK